jgi:hypothetical protein
MRSNGGVGGTTWFLVRTGAARRVVLGAVLAVLLGLAGATVLAAWAGARRTDSAFERLRAYTNHSDVNIVAEGDVALFDPTVALEGPGVREAGIAQGYPMVEITPDGTPDLSSDIPLIAPVGDVAFQRVDRPLFAAGRAPDPEDPGEIMVPEAMAAQGYELGRQLDVCVVDLEQAFAFGEGVVLQGTATREQQLAFVEEVCDVHHLEVVGVTRRGPDEVVLSEDAEADSFPIGSPAFVDAVRRPPLFGFAIVDLEPGADAGEYVEAVLDRAPPDAGVGTQASSLRSAVVERTLEPHVRALALFAALAALAAGAVLAPGIVRWAGAPPADLGTLRSLGIRPHQLRAAAAVRGAVLGAGAALVATGLAWLVSGRFPIGVGAQIEPFPGRRVDTVVLLVGAVALVGLAAALGAIAPATARTTHRRPSRLAAALQSMGIGPGPLAGVRAAVSGDGRGVGLLRTIGGVAIAVVAIVAALTYQAGLNALLDTPARYGWTWDRVLDTGDEALDPRLVADLAQSDDVQGVSVAHRLLIQHRGTEVQTFAFDRISGEVGPGVIAGREPVGDDEIAIAGQTLDRIGAELGDRLVFRGPRGDTAELTVVGRTLVPLEALGSELTVGEGAVLPMEALERLGGADPSLVLVELAPGAPPGAVEEIVTARGPGLLGGISVEGPSFSADLRGYDAVRRTPLLLGAVLAVLAVGVLGHTVATSVRRRRHELALLRCLGFTSRELRASVRWDVLTVVLACLVVALPVGVASGRLLWSRFAASLGVVEDPRTPVIAVAVVAAVTVAVSLAFAQVPARQATRLQPAPVLRTE